MPADWLPLEATASDIDAITAGLSDSQAQALLYDWRGTWARAEQLLPAGDWANWIILAGRGFGKTRTGAEAVREVVYRDPKARIALVGPTAADCRDVMVEGESGLLNVFPPWERPEYESSKRRITFKNGAIGFLYSAEEPERLRGPQHSFAHCLAGETLVSMADGSVKPMRAVRTGEWVHTRVGPSRVIGSGLTGRNREVFQLLTLAGRGIIGTSNHPVWTDTCGFLPLASLTPEMSLLCASNVLNGTGLSGIVTAPRSTGNGKSDCTEQYGNRPTGQFPRDSKFTTATAIRQITESRISRCSRMGSIAAFICRQRSRRKPAPAAPRPPLQQWRENVRKIWSVQSRACIAGLASSVRHLNQHPIVPASALMPPDRAHFQVKSETAPVAGRDTWRVNGFSSIAQSCATRGRLRTGQRKWWSALLSAPTAAKDSAANALMPGSVHATAPWSFTAEETVYSVKKLAKSVDVYNLTVEAGEYFANGILVHNCDEVAFYKEPQELWDNLKFGLRLGDDPRVVVTTTPQPSKFLTGLIADKNTIVSRGSTFDNKANLPAGVLAEFLRVYGGTRIGRQELYGELLNEAEGALWRRVQLAECRRHRNQLPDLTRVVVAVDPAVTSGESADETGIVVCAEDADGNGYVLADRTCRLPPDQWAAEVVRAYDEYEADRVIAEANNGGDLVESVLRTIRRNLPYKKVHASRGKVARAEPVAALYEQSRIFHAGAFPALEDEQVTFVPGKLARRSPNRVDALVWGMTFLLLGDRKHIGKAIWVT